VKTLEKSADKWAEKAQTAHSHKLKMESISEEEKGGSCEVGH